MEMKDYNFLSECLRSVLKEKFKDIPLKTRNKIIREFDLEVLRYGYLRTDFTRTLVMLLCYASNDIEWVKKELAKNILFQKDCVLDIPLSQEHLRVLLQICCSFINKTGYYDDFKALLKEWNNDMLNNPLLPFYREILR